MRWWAEMTQIGDNWDQRDGIVRNLMNHELVVRPLTQLINDLDFWFRESEEEPSLKILTWS